MRTSELLSLFYKKITRHTVAILLYMYMYMYKKEEGSAIAAKHIMYPDSFDYQSLYLKLGQGIGKALITVEGFSIRRL